MSIKSQKSLNEECSEIFEKSYSVMSESNESLSCDEDEESLSRVLLNKLTPAMLSKLRRCFKKAKDRNAERDIDRRVEEVMRAAAAEEGIEFAAAAPQRDALYLDEQGFVAAVENIFGNHKYTTHAHQLFQTLDSFGSGKVWWSQVVARLVLVGARSTACRSETWEPVSVTRVLKLEHCKRETIVKLVSIERPDSFCYAAVSRGGRVGVYCGELRLLHSYEVFYHRTGVNRRVKNSWITDAVYLSDVQCLLLSASDRSLTIYDVSSLTHTPLYCITGLPNIPTCLSYQPAASADGESELLVGTARGELVGVRFLRPRVALLHAQSPDTVNYYYWMELSRAPHTAYCRISRRRAHARSVRRVAHARDGDIVLSCSHDADASVRVRHVPAKLGDYVFKVQRGVSCFHALRRARALVAGGRDGAVRLWEPSGAGAAAALGARLGARLAAPGAPAVLDVAVLAALRVVVAYCANCCLYIWDLYEECLLQTLRIKFPFLGVLGKRVEFGTYCIHPGPPCIEETEENQEVAPSSRRGSSVYQGSTGGLILQADVTSTSWDQRRLDRDPESLRFDRPQLLVTCCDHVCVVQLGARLPRVVPPPRACPPHPRGPPQLPLPCVPPPRAAPRARRPSAWQLPADLEPAAETLPVNKGLSPPCPDLLKPVAVESPTLDIDELLERAGLQGILEKDFVLMQGLKHDLNKKLYEMEGNKEAVSTRWCLVFDNS
ncbi:unnamed protein product [Euphydryas editha]|uniref:Uncharacterized protein n=1 Tax=Euphydryas editha TaxID=104508 RepID=A0AAU9UK00_EUPED|nr:unnamed protein product [Euphydryas editha]